MRSGAIARTFWITAPPMEWPTTELALGAQLVGGGDDVTGRLLERLVALLVLALPEATDVSEDQVKASPSR